MGVSHSKRLANTTLFKPKEYTIQARVGEQIPLTAHIIPYTKTLGKEAIELYESTQNKKALPWQQNLLNDILAIDDNGLYIHQTYGFSVPRRNGKSEVIEIRCLWGLVNGESIYFTSHRQDLASYFFEKMVQYLSEAGYELDKDYFIVRTAGKEEITFNADLGSGRLRFKSRTTRGALGQGYDVLIVDEAQEYTEDQETALKYIVTDSANSQIIMCGTPPTAVSVGTVFTQYRKFVLSTQTFGSGWAEWSLQNAVEDITNTDYWYLTNPSLGYFLTERNILKETTSNPMDFNIQRLGVWMEFDLKSIISLAEWNACRVDRIPALLNDYYLGIRFSPEAENPNVCLSIAIRTKTRIEGRYKIFTECIDCRPFIEGLNWLVPYISNDKVKEIYYDGQLGQKALEELCRDLKISKKLHEIKVREVVYANVSYEQAIISKSTIHKEQPSVTQVITATEHRQIGSNGGYGFRCLKEGADISIMNSIILAHYGCSEAQKEKNKPKKQKIIT